MSFKRKPIMAWRCSGNSNMNLVSNLNRSGLIKHQDVAHAMKLVDRAKYCNEISLKGEIIDNSSHAYLDSPQYIGFNATISAPHMHCHALNYLLPNLKPGCRALDIGCGSGYLTACFAELVGPTGYVVGVDHIKELVDLATANIQNDNPSLLKHIAFRTADGRKGYEKGGPYDAIHVGAYSRDIPQELIDQLKPNGRMFIPTGHPEQIFLVHKDEYGNVSFTPDVLVNYVPLTSRSNQLESLRY